MTHVNLLLPNRIKDPSWLYVWAIVGELKGIVKIKWKEGKLGQENSQFEFERKQQFLLSLAKICVLWRE